MPSALATPSAPGSLDDVLERLTSVLRDAAPPGDAGGDPIPASPGPDVPAVTPPAPGSGASALPVTPEQLQAFRASVATEVAYLLAIPPLTPERYREIDEAFDGLFRMIKVAPYRPYVMSLLDHMLGRQDYGPGIRPIDLPPVLASFAAHPVFGERSVDGGAEDIELELIARELRDHVLGDGDRAIPIAAAVFYVVAGTAAGATIGYHVGKVVKEIF